MGMIVDKAVLSGLMGGVNVAKSGKAFLSIISEGPKIDKVCLQDRGKVAGGEIPFGTPVHVEILQVEQKFKDFNGSYSEALSATVKLQEVKHLKAA